MTMQVHVFSFTFISTVIQTIASEHLVIPKWQTVVPDTGIVVPLTGNSLTSWQLRSDDWKYVVEKPYLPSDLLTNLLQANFIDDPYLDRNFLTQRHVWMGDHALHDPLFVNRTRGWIYTTTFELPILEILSKSKNSDPSQWTWKLVLEGIKMGADVEMDGIHLGTVTNQFLRHEFKISDLSWTWNNTIPQLRTPKMINDARTHNLTITFDPSIAVDGRFTACSGGWDWAPYAKSLDAQGKRAYTLGIVKPIYLVAIQNVAIQHVVPKIYYRGPYPRFPMLAPKGDFDLQLDVHIDVINTSNIRSKRIKIVTAHHELWLPLSSLERLGSGETIVSANVTFRADDIDLWWPNGMGMQPLYDLFVGIDQNHELNSKQRPMMILKRIGFRTVAQVTINESDDVALLLASENRSEGSGSHGMYFRVNGAILLARGANFIPMDQLEGRLSDEAHRIAVQSAADANMNMMRIWGGGMILPDAFYDACDEFGILLYHDMMFVDEAGHRPVKSKNVENEIRRVVRSLASHPSIAVWNGCNECQVIMGTPSEIYATFVMQLVAQEDDTRSIWPSSPSKHGWKTGVYTLDSRPNGRPLSTWGPDEFSRDLETHGPYMRSFSRDYPGVNGANYKVPYKNTPPTLPQVPIGISVPSVFSSEFGATVMSSAESMAGTLSPEFRSLHGNSPPDSCQQVVGNENICVGGNVMAERNYPCDFHILAYFGNSTSLDAVGGEAFQEHMYHCLMSQTLWMKGEIETRRSKNLYGLLIWQLNENWPTGGWGCIEYGPVDQSGDQVIGGRWKPLMHLLESSLFRDVMVACGVDNQCFIRNDGQGILSTRISLESWHLGDIEPIQTYNLSVLLKEDTLYRFLLPPALRTNDPIILIKVYDSISERSIFESTFLPSLPKDIPGLRTPVLIKVESIEILEDSVAEIRLSSNQLALFVVLTTRAQGRFSENAFVLRPMESRTVLFFSFMNHETVEIERLRQTLRVEHLGYYLSRSNHPAEEEERAVAS